MKKKLFLSVTLFILVLLLAVPLVGCEVSCSCTTASLSEATMCTGVDDEARPLDSTDVFSPDIPEIFCSAKLSNAPDDTVVKAEWYYLEGETDYYLAEYELPLTSGTRYVGFSLSSEADWPTGDYKVVLYVDGKEELSVPFTVE